jgi:hypothetical protein
MPAMSNQACLIADDTPHPPAPELDDDPATNRLFVAGCSGRVPVFWLFCFDTHDLTHYQDDDGPVPALIAEMDKVRQRLADRDAKARELFPQYVAVWEQWRRVIDRIDRQYLKTDFVEVQMLYEDEDELACQLSEALDWFELGSDSERDHLLTLAGITTYDPAARAFTFDEANECAEKFLYGWLEVEG